MSLPWIRFDTSLPDNPKILALLDDKDGHRAGFVYCCALAYSGKHTTDGFIARRALVRVNGRQADAERLVHHGLWDPAEDGWYIHGWDEYQQSSEVTDQIRAKKRIASAKGNCLRHHGPDCGCWQIGPADDRRVRAVR